MSDIQVVEFNVAMDNEQKAAKNFVKVSLKVDMEDADFEILYKYALRSYRIELQGQIRPNWDTFIKGEYPKELKFGQALFGSTRGTKKVQMTPEEVKENLKNATKDMSMEEKIAYLQENGFM